VVLEDVDDIVIHGLYDLLLIPLLAVGLFEDFEDIKEILL